MRNNTINLNILSIKIKRNNTISLYLLIILSIFTFSLILNNQKAYASGVAKSFTQYSVEQSYANGGGNCGGEWQGEFPWLYSGSTSNDGQTSLTTFMVSPGGSITLNTQSENVVCDPAMQNYFGAPNFINDSNEDTCPFFGVKGDYFEPITNSITSSPSCSSPWTNAAFLSENTAYQFTSPSVTSGPGSASCFNGCNPVVNIPYTNNAQIWDPNTSQPSITYFAPLSLSTNTPTPVTITMAIYAVNQFQVFGNPPVYDCVNDPGGGDKGPSAMASPASYCSGFEEFKHFSFYVEGIAPPPTLSCSVINSNPAQVDTNGTFSATVGVTVGAFNAYNWQGSATLSGPGINGLSQTQSGLDLAPGSHNLTFSGLSANSPGTYTMTFTAKSTNGGSISNIPCSGQVVVGNEPYINVQGGNTITGANESGVGNLCTGTYSSAGILGYTNGSSGSGDNLAALAPDIINSFNSSNATNNFYGANNFNLNISEGLTFANTVNPPWGGNFGASGNSSCTPDYYESAPSTTGNSKPKVANNVPPLNTLTSATPGCNGIGNVTFCWFSGPAGRTNISATGPISNNLILFIDGDANVQPNVYLNYDQNRNLSFANVSDIPSFYLIANGDIYVDNSGGVSNPELDGVYVAQPYNRNEIGSGNPLPVDNNGGGHIFTCTDNTNNNPPTRYDYVNPTGPSDLVNKCNNGVLTFTGAVIANQVKLERTNGNVIGGSPAELFHYVPFIWMVDPFTTTTTQTATPVYQSITALPPVL